MGNLIEIGTVDFVAMPDFQSMGKIPRLNREMILTEKIDGTNAQVYVDEYGSVHAGSRNRWITPDKDNYGFAAWVRDHEEELRALGPGRHYGEWYGKGIQRGYGLDHRRFALFNVARWHDERPACCNVVPTLAIVDNISGLKWELDYWRDALYEHGSRAAFGFRNPEGIVIWHAAARQLFKVTLENDAVPKALAA